MGHLDGEKGEPGRVGNSACSEDLNSSYTLTRITINFRIHQKVYRTVYEVDEENLPNLDHQVSQTDIEWQNSFAIGVRNDLYYSDPDDLICMLSTSFEVVILPFVLTSKTKRTW